MGIQVQPCCCGGCSHCTEPNINSVTIAFNEIADRVDAPPQCENCANCNERFAAAEFVIDPLFDNGTTCSGNITVHFLDGCPDFVAVGITFGTDYIEVTLQTTDVDVCPVPPHSTPDTGSTVVYRIDATTTPALEIVDGKYACLQSVVPLLSVTTDGHDCDYTTFPSYASIGA